MNKPYHICFYFPYKDDSGVPVLFARLANNIAHRYPDFKVTIIDYDDGAMSRNIADYRNIERIIFHDDQVVVPPNDAILVQQSDVPYYWPENLQPKDNTLLYFWNLHPRNFIPSLLPLPYVREWPFNNFSFYKKIALLYPRLLRNLYGYVSLLLKHKALNFMDSTNYNFTKKYLFMGEFENEYLPVPAYSVTKQRKVAKFKEDDLISYCWIGRVCDFKAYILLYTVNKLAEIAAENSLKIKYLIVGDGPLTEYVQQNIRQNNFFSVEFCGAIPHKEIDDFLLNRVDVVTAMGTSALESAKLGIPTILLDISYKRIEKDYIFRWLYNTQNYDLGHIISDEDFDKGNTSLAQMVLSVVNNYQREADKSYAYFENNHGMNSVTDKFLDFVSQSSLTYSMIDKKYYKKPLLLTYYNNLRKLKN